MLMWNHRKVFENILEKKLFEFFVRNTVEDVLFKCLVALYLCKMFLKADYLQLRFGKILMG